MQTILCDFKECPMCVDGMFCSQKTVILKMGVCKNIYDVQNGQILPRANQNFDREKVNITIYNANNSKDKEKNESSSN